MFSLMHVIAELSRLFLYAIIAALALGVASFAVLMLPQARVGTGYCNVENRYLPDDEKHARALNKVRTEIGIRFSSMLTKGWLNSPPATDTPSAGQAAQPHYKILSPSSVSDMQSRLDCKVDRNPYMQPSWDQRWFGGFEVVYACSVPVEYLGAEGTKTAAIFSGRWWRKTCGDIEVWHGD